MSFAQKVVIVTGASSGIGRSAALEFAHRGASVALVSRSESSLAEVVREISDSGGRAVACPADITAADSPSVIVKTTVDAFGGIDVLVNAAGVIATGTIE